MGIGRTAAARRVSNWTQLCVVRRYQFGLQGVFDPPGVEVCMLSMSLSHAGGISGSLHVAVYSV